MHLYLISANAGQYDHYYAAVVAAENVGLARRTHPDGKHWWDRKKKTWVDKDGDTQGLGDATWVPSPRVSVSYIGEAKPGLKAGVICEGFNAG